MIKTVRLDKEQKTKLASVLKKLDYSAKCELYHEAEDAVANKNYPSTSSEYVYDQLFINTDSPYYQGSE